MSRWFRYYDAALHDPKVQKLSGDQFKGWVNLLCLASENDGQLPGISDIAFALRIPDEVADTLIMKLVEAKLLDESGGYLSPHNWHARQYLDKTNAQRQRQYRERQKTQQKQGRSVSNTLRNVSVTSQDTDTDTDTEKKEITKVISKEKPKSRRTQIAPEAQPSEKNYQDAKPFGILRSEVPDLFAGYRDHHLKLGNLMADWNAAWRTWCRNSKKWDKPNGRGPPDQPPGLLTQISLGIYENERTHDDPIETSRTAKPGADKLDGEIEQQAGTGAELRGVDDFGYALAYAGPKGGFE